MPLDDNIMPEQFVAHVARVSNPGNQNNHLTAPRLLKYLKSHNHWSPFEMAHAVMEIETTRDIARQILRHRSFSFQEFSQRYAKAELDVSREARAQDPSNRQNSLPMPVDAEWQADQHFVAQVAFKAYEAALRKGIAKEVARAVLPEGLTKSRLYMAGSLRSWLHYIDLRTGPETQKEHREIAEVCKNELMAAFPNLFTE